MKRMFSWLAAVMLMACWLLPLPVAAVEGTGYYPDLSRLMDNEDRRAYVETMIGYYLRTDKAIRQTLKDGYSAVFFFDGASDNMDDPALSDISYYRVSAVCVVVRMNEVGKPFIAYYDEDSSTLPDRPLAYGAWEIEDVGEVGPATICDGTYELYSVKHGGKYEALHLRTSEGDDTIPAVYMKEGGFVTSRADMINIHTRNVNHILEKAMWSAGCILIGDGADFGTFTELIQSTYYSVYNSFQIGDRVGTVTIDRQLLKQALYKLYEDWNAVDRFLAHSRHHMPESYLESCTEDITYPKAVTLWAGIDTDLMSLPCSNATDARSVRLGTFSEGEALEVLGSVRNSAGNLWLRVEKDGREGYVFEGHAVEKSWFQRVFGGWFGD